MIDESLINSEYDYFQIEKKVREAISSKKAKFEFLSELIKMLSDKSENEIINKIILKYVADQKKINKSLPELEQELKHLELFYKSKFPRKNKARKISSEEYNKQAKKVSETITMSENLLETSIASDTRYKVVGYELKRLEKMQNNDPDLLEYIAYLKDLSEKLKISVDVDYRNWINGSYEAQKEIDGLFHIYDRVVKEIDNPPEPE